VKEKDITFSFGAELEFADVWRFDKLPDGCVWNTKDYTIVNTNGVANDPRGVLWKFGGEINTRPTPTIREQVELIGEIISTLNPKPSVNYKTNLHIHVSFGERFLQDEDFRLDVCKHILRYFLKSHQYITRIIDPLPIFRFRNLDDQKLFDVWLRKKRFSHHYISKGVIQKALKANNMQDFLQSFPNNNRMRMMINVPQITETNTIEFRHFFQSLDLHEIHSCFVWVYEWCKNALFYPGHSPEEILKRFPSLRFPRIHSFDADLYRGFLLTNHSENTKQTVFQNIRKMCKYHSILFVCNGNVVRSPTCEIIMKNLLPEGLISVKSCGLSATEQRTYSAKMRELVKKKGLVIPKDFSGKSQQITQQHIKSSELVIVMNENQKRRLHQMFPEFPMERIVNLAQYSSSRIKGIPDPAYTGEYKKVFDMLFECCVNLIYDIVNVKNLKGGEERCRTTQQILLV